MPDILILKDKNDTHQNEDNKIRRNESVHYWGSLKQGFTYIDTNEEHMRAASFKDTQTPTQSIQGCMYIIVIQLQVSLHIKPSFQLHLVWEPYGFIAFLTDALVTVTDSPGPAHKNVFTDSQGSFFPIRPFTLM